MQMAYLHLLRPAGASAAVSSCYCILTTQMVKDGKSLIRFPWKDGERLFALRDYTLGERMLAHSVIEDWSDVVLRGCQLNQWRLDFVRHEQPTTQGGLRFI